MATAAYLTPAGDTIRYRQLDSNQHHNAPEAREIHTAVWTGSEMIVWGGYGNISGLLNTGGRYDPATDSWTATSTTMRLTPDTVHTAVWTGTEMIVWGGYGNISDFLTPAGDMIPLQIVGQQPAPRAPEARYYHTAVWTGSDDRLGRSGTLATILTPVGDMILLQIAGQQRARRARLKPATITPRSGREMK